MVIFVDGNCSDASWNININIHYVYLICTYSKPWCNIPRVHCLHVHTYGSIPQTAVAYRIEEAIYNKSKFRYCIWYFDKPQPWRYYNIMHCNEYHGSRPTASIFGSFYKYTNTGLKIDSIMILLYTCGLKWLWGLNKQTKSYNDQNLCKRFLNILIFLAITTSLGRLFQYNPLRYRLTFYSTTNCDAQHRD